MMKISPIWPANLTIAGAGKKTWLLLILPALTGCASMGPQLSVTPQRYRLDLQLSPPAHKLTGRAVLDLSAEHVANVQTDGTAHVELLLHPALRIDSVRASGARVVSVHHGPTPKKDEELSPRSHYVVLDHPAKSFTLFVDYHGDLYQDIAAGEKAGEIHNFQMQAHIGEEGVYLAGGYWYPQPAVKGEAVTSLADYTVIVASTNDFEYVAGADRAPDLSNQTGRLAWRTSYPVDSMVLVGGQHKVYQKTILGTSVSLHLKESQVDQVDGLFEAVERNFSRYEPLIGKYPAKEFSIVDNFFSSGFAFPSFTLLSSAVIDMGKRSQTAHGYIDHEMLHSWWGNGVHVNTDDGNWCEALASYGANYYGYVLDGKNDEARRKRRNYCHFLSRIKPEKDKPLGTFGQDDGCGRGIAYQKGAMVFHMLAKKIGQDKFWDVMRKFTKDFVGHYASWDDIRSLCEAEYGESLERFFRQWVRSGSAPMLSIEQARYDSSDQVLTLHLKQGEPAFELDIPVRITHAAGFLDVVVPLSSAEGEIALAVDVIPLTVEVDPDYDVFRKIPAGQIIPTTSATRSKDSLVVVMPSGDVPESLTSLKSIFATGKKEDKVTVFKAGKIQQRRLADTNLLILGEAVRDPYIEAFLSAIQYPLKWIEGGFEFEGVTYAQPGDAILCTARQPGVEGGGVTVLFANSDEAIPRAMLIPFYDHSVVIFHNQKPIIRSDFEIHNIVEVDRS